MHCRWDLSVKGDGKMKKTYKIEVDCANCANLMEQAAKNTAGVADAVVNFMTLKMKVEFAEGGGTKAGHGRGAEGMPQGGAGM